MSDKFPYNIPVRNEDDLLKQMWNVLVYEGKLECKTECKDCYWNSACEWKHYFNNNIDDYTDEFKIEQIIYEQEDMY